LLFSFCRGGHCRACGPENAWQSLLNLASNANKFTEKGTITIAAHQGRENGRDWITLAVADTGIGMTPEHMGKLFQEFSRLPPQRQANTVARGLASPSVVAFVR
jgi:signal transduction histidine kinase